MKKFHKLQYYYFAYPILFFWKAEHENHTNMCTIFRGLLKIFASNVQCVRYKYVC